MKIFNLTLESGKKITVVLSGNATFSDNRYQDGTHNNGGWPVKESREEIIQLILGAKEI